MGVIDMDLDLDLDMDDVDIYLQSLKEKQEVDDFIKHGLYPERLAKKPFHVKYMPEMDELPLNNIPHLDYKLNEELDSMLSVLYTVECELKKNIASEMELKLETDNSCPICMEHMTDANYVVPKCGHRLCVNCFVTNMRINTHTGHTCSQCRRDIVSRT